MAFTYYTKNIKHRVLIQPWVGEWRRDLVLRRPANAHSGSVSSSLAGAQRFGVGHQMPDTKSLRDRRFFHGNYSEGFIYFLICET